MDASFNPKCEEKGRSVSIKVYLRVRPLTQTELSFDVRATEDKEARVEQKDVGY